MKFDNKTVLNFLVNNLHYSNKKAKAIIPDLQALVSPLDTYFEDLVAGKTLPNYEVLGYSLEKFITKYKMNSVAALLTMDWLIKEPTTAVSALKETYID